MGKAMTFDEWWKSAYEWGFGVRWLEPLAKRFAQKAWEARGTMTDEARETARNIRYGRKSA
jgi:hypothetical protein